MSGILGKKLGMTRLIQDDGHVIPITVVICEPNEVAQVKTVEKDGYPAVVLGFSKLKKPTKNKKFRHLREFRITPEEVANYKKGDEFTLKKLGEIVNVKTVAISKGKGFQGVVRRYHFAGGGESHGSHAHREPGSIGCRAKPGRVHKGKRLPGRMGCDRVTRITKVAYIDAAKHILGLKGQVAGPNGGLVIINKI